MSFQPQFCDDNIIAHFVYLLFYYYAQTSPPFLSVRQYNQDGRPVEARVSCYAGKFCGTSNLYVHAPLLIALEERLQPSGAVSKFNERVKRIGKVNTEIADWLQVHKLLGRVQASLCLHWNRSVERWKKHTSQALKSLPASLYKKLVGTWGMSIGIETRGTS